MVESVCRKWKQGDLPVMVDCCDEEEGQRLLSMVGREHPWLVEETQQKQHLEMVERDRL
jgi:hypothetical protein